VIGVVSFLVSFAICVAIVASERWHVGVTADLPGSGPQKVHSTPIPRIGGVALFLAVATSLFTAGSPVDAGLAWSVGFVASLSAPFAFGLHEDITGRASPALRLLGTAIAAVIAYSACNVVLVSFGVPIFDSILQLHWIFALLLSIFCVCAIAHAFNLVDGLNGLLASMALVACTGVAVVAQRIGDGLSLSIALALLGAIIGFAIFNFPRARLFAGDSGAYVLGTAISLLAMLFVARNSAVSPWFVFALVLYPFADTSAAIARRIYRKKSISSADAEHLHSLLARVPASGTSSGALGHLATPLIASVSLGFAAAATALFTQTRLLMSLAATYFVCYALAYLFAKRRTAHLIASAWNASSAPPSSAEGATQRDGNRPQTP
jgi:UDP-GlcNAc:undecaprenyl-phosphate/decaprenyl-phosphate GlcNAc-1-phosphate transferase